MWSMHRAIVAAENLNIYTEHLCVLEFVSLCIVLSDGFRKISMELTFCNLLYVNGIRKIFFNHDTKNQKFHIVLYGFCRLFINKSRLIAVEISVDETD